MRITFESDCGSAAFDSDNAPYVLTAIDGLGGADGELHTTTTPLQDGATWLCNTAQARSISVSGAIIGDDEARASLRRNMTKAMTAKAGLGVLTIEAYGRTRKIGATIERGPVFAESDGDGIAYQEFTYSLYCPDPFFYADSTVKALAVREGGLTFPLRLLARFSKLNVTGKYLCENGGDVKCAIEAEFSAGASGPKLLNADTGEYIKIKRDIPAGYTLIITTGFNEKAAYLKDISSGAVTDAMGYLDLKSTFFQLKPGANYLSFATDGGTTTVNVAWRARYAGF